MDNLSNMQDQKKPSIAGFITFCTATSFILTVLYVYALSIPLACNLLQYFTVEDYFKQAIQWLVPIVLSNGIGLVVGRMMPIMRVWWKDTDTRIRFLTVILCLILVLIPVVFWTIHYLGYSKAVRSQLYFGVEMVVIGIISLSYIASLKPHKDDLRLAIGDYKFVIYIVVLFMLMGWFRGLAGGERLKERTNQTPKIRISLLELASPLQGQMVFLLEKYVVFLKQNETTVTAIPTSLIRLIEELRDAEAGTKP
jgi:hypothetical protein